MFFYVPLHFTRILLTVRLAPLTSLTISPRPPASSTTAYRLQIVAVHLASDGDEPLLIADALAAGDAGANAGADTGAGDSAAVQRLRTLLTDSLRSAPEVHSGAVAGGADDLDRSDADDDLVDDDAWCDAARAARAARRVERHGAAAAWRAAFVASGGLSTVLGVIARGDFAAEVQLVHAAVHIVKLCLRESGPASSAAARATATGSSGAALLKFALDQLPELDLRQFVETLVVIVTKGHGQLVSASADGGGALPERAQLLASTLLDVLTVLETLAQSDATSTAGLSTAQMFPAVSNAHALVTKTLLRSPSRPVREASRRTLIALAHSEPCCFRFVFGHCAAALESLDSDSDFSAEFFLLTTDLLESAFASLAANGGAGAAGGDAAGDAAGDARREVVANVARMKKRLWRTLNGWPRGAGGEGSGFGGGVTLTASLSLLAVLEGAASAEAVGKESEGSSERVADVTAEWILAVPSAARQDAWPLSKHPAARAAAFDLLFELARTSDSCLAACIAQLSTFERASSTYFAGRWKLVPRWNIADTSVAGGKGRRRFVGLKNQGFTCYLNSLMQQLFMAKVGPRALRSAGRGSLSLAPARALSFSHARSPIELYWGALSLSPFFRFPLSLPPLSLSLLPPPPPSLSLLPKAFSSTFLESRNLGRSRELGAGSEVVEVHIDSDADPDSVVGKRVEVTWVSGNVFRGVVTGRFGQRQHVVQYEDGDEVTYQLTKGRRGFETESFRLFDGEVSQVFFCLLYILSCPLFFCCLLIYSFVSSILCCSSMVPQEEGRLQVIRQVKRTFCFLKKCVNSYYDPLSLVEACRTLRLDSDVMQQNDASEVFYKLLDRIEEGTKVRPVGWMRVLAAQSLPLALSLSFSLSLSLSLSPSPSVSLSTYLYIYIQIWVYTCISLSLSLYIYIYI